MYCKHSVYACLHLFHALSPAYKSSESNYKQALHQEHTENSLKSWYINYVCIMYDNFPGPSRQRGYTAAAVWFSIDTGGLLPGIPIQNQPTCCGNARVPNDREYM